MVSLYHRIKRQVNGKNYCLKHIRKLAAKGANSACVEEKVVYGWAVHYFEEESIEGTLYNEDGTEYKPAPKPTPAKVKTVEPKKPEQRQPTLFDFMEPETPEPESKTKTMTTRTNSLTVSSNKAGKKFLLGFFHGKTFSTRLCRKEKEPPVSDDSRFFVLISVNPL